MVDKKIILADFVLRNAGQQLREMNTLKDAVKIQLSKINFYNI